MQTQGCGEIAGKAPEKVIGLRVYFIFENLDIQCPSLQK